ncbi:MAG: pseudouridine synthase [Alphaproteobacteria bacterium]|jgi:23S rRNA pseudouridine2605 synthase|nr:pseudouridine synthase [Alphaproteobacteria bacterium]
MEKVRIAKFIAGNSEYSRRKVESLIFDGEVKVNGKVVEEPSIKVSVEDKIVIEGSVLKVSMDEQREEKIFAFYKPTGCICSKKDEKGRKTIYDVIADSSVGKKILKENSNLLYVGRLDFNTEGILLMTNSGDLKNKLEHPSAKLERVYRVKVFSKKKLDDKDLNPLRKGISFKDKKTGKKVSYSPFDVKIIDYVEEDVVRYNKGKKIVTKNSFNKGDGKSVWCEVRIFEGKNREIRNAFEQIGFVVSKLSRLSYGPYNLEGLKRGEIIKRPVVKSLVR